MSPQKNPSIPPQSNMLTQDYWITQKFAALCVFQSLLFVSGWQLRKAKFQLGPISASFHSTVTTDANTMQTPRQGRASQLLFTLLFVQLFKGGQQNQDSQQLLVFLIDGFRYDYLDDLDTLPGFREIVNSGVKVDYMTPDFPTLSYPNYYTLMTGNLLPISTWLRYWWLRKQHHWVRQKFCFGCTSKLIKYTIFSQ